MRRLVVLAVSACGSRAAPAAAPVGAEAPAASACAGTPEPMPVPSPMYAALFTEGAAFQYSGTIVGEDDDTGMTMVCDVAEVRHYDGAIGARLMCTGWNFYDDVDGPEGPSNLPIPAAGSPSASYVATSNGLYRVPTLPAEDTTPALTDLMMLPSGERRLLEGDGDTGQWLRPGADAMWCHDEVRGTDWPDDSFSVSICFRPGGGIVAGGYSISIARTDEFLRGRWALVSFSRPDADELPEVAAAHPVLAINEVSAAADWFEIVNLSSTPVSLSDFVYTDHPGDLARAVAFPPISLPAGALHVQQLSDDVAGFLLNGTESLSLYRRSDHTREDTISWDEGDSPVDGSFARTPDGTFRTLDTATPCAANQ